MQRTYLFYLLLFIAALIRIFFQCRPDLITCLPGEEGEEIHYYYQEDLPKEQENNIFNRLRNYWQEQTYQYFPSPHSELLLGMTVGIDNLREVPKFKEMLRETGTIHVVVVSGYNVSLVYNMVVKVLGSPYKSKNLILGIAATLFYALLSGFEPPVVRSWFMGSIVALGKYYGRKFNVIRVLLLTGLLLIIFNPQYLYSLSFQLSFLATLSLVLFESHISSRTKKLLKTDFVMLEDLNATMAAQILIWPYLSYKFGQVSLVSVLINTLILWTVPLATIWGGAFLLFSGLNDFLAMIFSQLVFLPLDFFVFMVRNFSKLPFATIEFQINIYALLLYYFLVGVIYYRKVVFAK
jgi:competence protein ComEC